MGGPRSRLRALLRLSPGTSAPPTPLPAAPMGPPPLLRRCRRRLPSVCYRCQGTSVFRYFRFYFCGFAVSCFDFFFGGETLFSSLMKTCRLFPERLQWKLLFLLKMANKSIGFIQSSFSFAICSMKFTGEMFFFHGNLGSCISFKLEIERGPLPKISCA